ncbi:MAG: ABC transporter substrate-binding protein [Clostridia bacterium]|nr:ABC transporter substrate-binding protein [Clostridia bacterium]
MIKKRVMAVSIIVIMVAIILGIVTAVKNTGKEEKLKTIKVNEVTRSVFYAPQYVAINNGYFKENGMEIELTTGQGADAVMTAVLANQCDIGFAGPEASIYVYQEGKEDYAQVFAQMTKKDGSFLVARNKTEKFNWEDLRGKTIIPGRKGGVPYMTLEYVLKKHNIDPQKDAILDDSIKFDLMAGAFASGNADYVTLFEPTASLTQNEQKGYVVASVGEAAGEIPYTAYFAKKSYIESNEETVQKFTNSIYKGQQWVKEHSSQEIAKSIQNFFPDTDLELLSSVIQNYKNIDAWNDTPVLKEEAFNRLQEVMTMAGELKEKAPYEKIVNNKYSTEAIK